MSNKTDLYIMRGYISELPELDQEMIASYYTSIKQAMGADQYAVVALSLVALELAVEQEG